MAPSYAVFGIVILLTANFLKQVSCLATELDVYKEGSTPDMEQLSRWMDSIGDARKAMTDSEKAEGHLKDESCKNKTSACCRSLESAEQSRALQTNCNESGLLMAECYALFVYTDGAYWEFTAAARKGDFETYKVLNYLINCAVIQLSLNAKNKVNDSEKLFRGLKTEHTRPNADRIFWIAFATTSRSEKQASEFGNKTKIEFEPSAAQYGAKIQDFSKFSDKEEVIVSPFEIYDVLKSEANDNQTIRFRSSQRQVFGPLHSC